MPGTGSRFEVRGSTPRIRYRHADRRVLRAVPLVAESCGRTMTNELSVFNHLTDCLEPGSLVLAPDQQALT